MRIILILLFARYVSAGVMLCVAQARLDAIHARLDSIDHVIFGTELDTY